MRYPENEVAAMKARLEQRMEQRRWDAEIDQVIAIVHRVPFGEAPQARKEEVSAGGERLVRRQLIGFEDLKRVAAGSWMVAMTLAVVAFLCYGLRMV